MAHLLARSLVALVTVGLSLTPDIPARADDAPAARISTRKGDVTFSKEEITCRVAGGTESRPLGAILAGPQVETLYDQAGGLTSIAAASPNISPVHRSRALRG